MSKTSRINNSSRRDYFRIQTDYTSKTFRACDSKTGYRSDRIATREAERLMSEQGVQYLRTYKCQFCKKFHLTSKVQITH